MAEPQESEDLLEGWRKDVVQGVRTVAVDFDGVIHEYSMEWHDGTIYDPPLDRSLEALKRLQRARIAVYVHTTRDADKVAQWLSEHGVEATDMCEEDHRFWSRNDLVLVTDQKLPAVAYIDDRGIRFHNWDQTLVDLLR